MRNLAIQGLRIAARERQVRQIPRRDPVKGECLCGSVKFEVDAPPSRIYQCHCSLCRKQSGTGSNAAFIVKESQLHWSHDNGTISSYARSTGFRSDFCARCGSPVPNQIGITQYIWVPVGLLNNPGQLEIAMHLFMDSRAEWEPTPNIGVLHASTPSLEVVLVGLKLEFGT